MASNTGFVQYIADQCSGAGEIMVNFTPRPRDLQGSARTEAEEEALGHVTARLR